jgi:hypothetical protein
MSERKEALFKIIVAVVTGLILWAWGYLTIVLTIVNWLIALFANRRNKSIAEFIEYWNTTTYTFYRYISGVANERPFPFTSIQRISKFKK